MAKFLFVYRNNAELAAQKPSPEEMQQAMATWGEWFQKVGAAIVDGGDGLMPTGKIVRTDAVTDGPFIEAKELVGGFSIVQAASYDDAVELAKTCPVTVKGGAVEIRELAGYSDITGK